MEKLTPENSEQAEGQRLGVMALPADLDARVPGVIYREQKRLNENLFAYQMEKEICGFHFLFKVYQRDVQEFGLWFKTKEYDYALLDLPPGGVDQIFTVLREMVVSIEASGQSIMRIHVDPATHEYSRHEVDEMEKILLERGLPKEHVAKMPSWEKQSAVKYGEGGEENEFATRRTEVEAFRARGRLFRIYFRKYFPEWDLEADPWGTNFTMVRKESAG